MKALLVRYLPPGVDNDCYFGIAEVSVGTTTLLVENFFGADREPAGVALDLEIRPDFAGLQESWEQIFGGNPKNQTALVPLGGASYRALGQIASINPMIADCGLISLRVPLSSNDAGVIGAHVGFTVSALAGYWVQQTLQADAAAQRGLS